MTRLGDANQFFLREFKVDFLGMRLRNFIRCLRINLNHIVVGVIEINGKGNAVTDDASDAYILLL